MRRTSGLAPAAYAVMLGLLLCMALVTAGCSSATGPLDNMASTTTPSDAAEGPTSQTAAGSAEPAVTYESSSSPCLVVDVFSQGGEDYLVVDYIQIKWVSDEYGEDAQPKISNTNTKLRTFIIPAGADLTAVEVMVELLGESGFETFAEPYGYEPPITVAQLKEARAGGFVNSGTAWGFWNIGVSGGKVMSLKEDISG